MQARCNTGRAAAVTPPDAVECEGGLLRGVWHEIEGCGYSLLIGLVCLNIIAGVVNCSGETYNQICPNDVGKCCPMAFSKNIVIPDNSKNIIRIAAFNIFDSLFIYRVKSCVVDFLGRNHGKIEGIGWITLIFTNITEVWGATQNTNSFYSGSFPCVFILNLNGHRTAITNWAYDNGGLCRSNPRPFIEGTSSLHFFKLHLGICLAASEFVFHRLSLTVENAPFHIIEDTINTQTDKPKKFYDEERSFYGVLPPFAGVILSLFGITALGWGWWNIRFFRGCGGWRLVLAILGIILGGITCYYGFGSLLVWSLTW